MIYDSLRKIPMVTFLEIIDSGDISLLSDEEIPIEQLVEIWNNLYESYKSKYDSQNHNKVFNLSKEIDFLVKKYDSIKLSVEALKFDANDSIIQVLRDYGYTLRLENYNDDVARISRESEGIINKINQIKNSLPKAVESEEKGSEVIISVMADYASFLGYDFDFYTISVEKFGAMQNTVKQKVASIEKQNSKNKSK